MPVPLEAIRSIEYPEIQDLGEFEESNEGTPEGEEVTDDAGEADVPGNDAGVPDGVASAPADPGPAAAQEAEPEAQEEVTDERLTAYDRLNQEWRDDPASLVRKFVAGLTPEQRAAAGIGDAPADTATPAEWEAQSDGEEWLQKHTKSIEAIPQIAQGMRREFAVRDQYINSALVQSESNNARLDAILQILGVELPPIDPAAVASALADGKTSYADAIKKVYKPALDKAVANKKQAAKPRPRTPGDQGNDIPQVKAGMSMNEILAGYTVK